MKSRRNYKNPTSPTPKGNRVQKTSGVPVDRPGPHTDHSNHMTADLSPQTQAYAMGGMGGNTPFSDTDQDGK